MKFLFLFFLFFIIHEVHGQFTFNLYGTVPINMNGKQIVLSIRDNYSWNKYVKKDTIVIKNNAFSFKGNIARLVEKAEISLLEKGQFFYFVLDTGHIIMNVKKLPKKWPTYKNKLSNIEINNSTSNLINDTIRNLTNQYYIEYGKPVSKNNLIIQLDSAKREELWKRKLSIVKKYPNDLFSIVCLYDLLNERRKNAEDIMNALSLMRIDLQNSDLGKELYGKLIFITSTYIGHKIPKITSQSNLNTPFSTKNLENEVYLLVFGATWCMPCKDNYPTIKKIHSKYKNNGFKVVAINLDDNINLWNKQIQQFGLADWIHISELKKMRESDIARNLSITYIPFYILVNKHGIITYNTSQVNDPDLSILDHIVKKSVNEQ